MYKLSWGLIIVILLLSLLPLVHPLSSMIATINVQDLASNI